MKPQNLPRILITALRGGSGKTILSVGLIAAWVKRGKHVAPFKKGPDYIDAGWLALSAGRPCHNLDSFLVSEDGILNSFFFNSRHSDIAVIEGNRGLYDGIDTLGHTSTAELAKLLKAPVVLCLDCTKSTRTMAAIVLGCLQFDPKVFLKGVILNRIAGARHERIIRENIEYHCGLPVLGAVPRLKDQSFPERHMGLIPTQEHGSVAGSVEVISEIASTYLDLDAIEELACTAVPLNFVEPEKKPLNYLPSPKSEKNSPRIAVIRDSAFQFYYPENLEALKASGASLVYISPFTDKDFPSVDALYIGGGFPETHAEALAENLHFMETLKTEAEKGLPIYAECGGLMYLGEKLVLKGKTYRMAGVLPLVFGLCKRPQGHGYTVVSVEKKNPFYPVGMEIKGHEFHYSKVLEWTKNPRNLVFHMKRGTGMADGKDGFCYKNILATYTHVHALGTPQWAVALVRKALEYKTMGRKLHP